MNQKTLPAMATAAIVVWGATAYTYINTGFSIAMIVFVLYVLWSFIKKEPRPHVQMDSYMLMAFGIFYGALLLSTLFHLDDIKNLSGGYFSLFGFIQYTFPLWMLLYIGGKHDIRKAICGTIYAFLYIMCLYGIAKYFILGEGRLSSFYYYPTRIGMMLDMFLPFTAAFTWYYRKNKMFVSISVILLILEVMTLILAKVRGSLLAISIAVLFTLAVILFQQRIQLSSKWKHRLYLGGILLIGSCIGYAVFIGWGDPLRMIGGERFLFWESSYLMWLDHPLAGVGLNGWQAAFAGPYLIPGSREVGQVMPHNVFIYFFATAGTIGGIGYLAYCGFMLKFLLQKINTCSSSPFGWAMLFMFIAATAHGLTDQTFILKLTGRIFYMLLGVGILFSTVYKDHVRD